MTEARWVVVIEGIEVLIRGEVLAVRDDGDVVLWADGRPIAELKSEDAAWAKAAAERLCGVEK